MLVTVQVVAGTTLLTGADPLLAPTRFADGEPSPLRLLEAMAKPKASKIEESEKREIAGAIWSAEARTEEFFFIFVVRVQLKSPESGHKRDIYFAFLA